MAQFTGWKRVKYMARLDEETKKLRDDETLWIASNIGLFIKLKGLTQADLAKRLFYTRQTIANWINGEKRPGKNAISMIEEVLGLHKETLTNELTSDETYDLLKEVLALNKEEREIVLETAKKLREHH